MEAAIPLKKYKQLRGSRIWQRNTQTLVSLCGIGQIWFIVIGAVIKHVVARGSFLLTQTE